MRLGCARRGYSLHLGGCAWWPQAGQRYEPPGSRCMMASYPLPQHFTQNTLPLKLEGQPNTVLAIGIRGGIQIQPSEAQAQGL